VTKTTKLRIYIIRPLNAKLNLIRQLLALLGAHHILHVSRTRVKHRMTLNFGSKLNAEENKGAKNGSFTNKILLHL
jgi:hypothetical protein